MSENSEVFTYEGAAVDAQWDKRLCIHVGECTRAKGAIFTSGRNPWGQPDNAEADIVAEVVSRCPTGSLTFERKDGGAAELPDRENTVLVSDRGPLYVRGDLRIAGVPDDMPGVAFRAALCRCGKSANKPFCDNSHEGVSFADHGPIGDTGTSPVEPGGPLEITPLRDGPLLLHGDVTLIAGNGRRAWRGAKVALCRCGESASKPFCDGTHTTIDFTTD